LQLSFDPAAQGEFRVYVINLDLQDGCAHWKPLFTVWLLHNWLPLARCLLL
jgi:hypothetical protein